MILKNAVVYGADFAPQKLDIAVSDGVIARLGAALPDADGALDCAGCTVVPGFVDIHIHGGGGGDMADADAASLQRMSRYLAARGVTSFCPASMTLPFEELRAQFAAVEAFKGSEQGAHILGVRMEGPYISMEKKGAQCADYVRAPDLAEFRALDAVSPVCAVDVAPEVDGALDLPKRRRSAAPFPPDIRRRRSMRPKQRSRTGFRTRRICSTPCRPSATAIRVRSRRFLTAERRRRK